VDFSDNSTPVKEVNTFVYAGGSTTLPKALPPNDIELNLIPQGIRITGFVLGFVLGGLSMLIALWWLLWTIYYRNKDVVRIAQPIFLCQLIVGAFIGLAILYA
jgi:di/tricarboxylate transporter